MVLLVVASPANCHRPDSMDGLVQGFRIEIGSIRPQQCLHLRIDADLIEERQVAQRSCAQRRKVRTEAAAVVFTDLVGSGDDASRRVGTVAATPRSVQSAGTLRGYTNVRMLDSDEGGALRWYGSPGLSGIPGSSTETRWL